MNDKVFDKAFTNSLVKGKTYRNEDSDIGVKLQMLKNAKEVYLLYQEAIKQEKSGNSQEAINLCNRSLNMLMAVQKDAKHKNFTIKHVNLFLDKYGKEPKTYKNSSFIHDYPIGMRYKESDLPNTILVCEDRFSENEPSKVKREFLLRLNFMEMSLKKRIDWNRYIIKHPDWTPNDMWEFLNNDKNRNAWWPAKGYKNIKNDSYAMEGLFSKKSKNDAYDESKFKKLYNLCKEIKDTYDEMYDTVDDKNWSKVKDLGLKLNSMIDSAFQDFNNSNYSEKEVLEAMKNSNFDEMAAVRHTNRKDVYVISHNNTMTTFKNKNINKEKSNGPLFMYLCRLSYAQLYARTGIAKATYYLENKNGTEEGYINDFYDEVTERFIYKGYHTDVFIDSKGKVLKIIGP